MPTRRAGLSMPDAARARKAQTARRLDWVRDRWNDDAYFEAVVSSGRYLKLCNLLEWAETLDGDAALRVSCAG